MSNTIIEISNLSKQYTLGQNASYVSLRDQLAETLCLRKQSAPKPQFWALKDIDFNVERGNTLGIIGRNGAGKSTLLKILSRITPPTKGKVTIHGRLASLLEVGTGFHSELTGRENIYLNGAILGMSQNEIKKKFDAIIDFSEIEGFLDTPVKRYSSGMYVRLAFAVAAHLEPEILIVDEVLAVGDAKFQKKCIGKMSEVRKEGKTVLFVSHNMAAIKELCQKCVLLDHGKQILLGKTHEVINHYLTSGSIGNNIAIDLSKKELRKNSLPDSLFKFTKMEIINSKNKLTSNINLGEPFKILIHTNIDEPVDDLEVAMSFMSSMGFPLFNTHIDAHLDITKLKGNVTFILDFPTNLFGPGVYSIGVGANGTGVTDWIPEATIINIEAVGENNKIHNKYDGVINYPCKWSIV